MAIGILIAFASAGCSKSEVPLELEVTTVTISATESGGESGMEHEAPAAAESALDDQTKDQDRKWKCRVDPEFVEIEAYGADNERPKKGPGDVVWILDSGSADLVARVVAKPAEEQGECRQPSKVDCSGEDQKARGQRIRKLFNGGNAIEVGKQREPVRPEIDKATPFKNEEPRDGSADQVDTQQITWWYTVEVTEVETDTLVCSIDPRVCVRDNGTVVCQNI